MKIAIVGTGYVGLVTGVCFANTGNDVICADINQTKIDLLNKGKVPIYEPGLSELLFKNRQRLEFTTDIPDAIRRSDIVFSCVGTPPDEDGSADLSYVLDVARQFGAAIKKYTIFVTKSTVPVGTAEKVRCAIMEAMEERTDINGFNDLEFDVVSNPEFLKEGTAIHDFMHPERVVIGVDSSRAGEVMAKLYSSFMVVSDRLITTTIPSAEMIKYAANSMLATRISFMNEMANLCEKVGANIDEVRKGIGSDSRIGKSFLYAGCGYGGSCFPKDVRALIKTGEEHGEDMHILKSVMDVNDNQKHVLFKKVKSILGGNVKGKTIGIWGLAFKPETDDMRESPSLVLIDELLQAGATVRAYDPIAMPECKRRIGDAVYYGRDMYDAAKGTDVVALVTEWQELRNPDIDKLKGIMNGRVMVVDGRNILNRQLKDREDIDYIGIGI